MSTWQEYVDGHAAGCTKAPLSAVAGFRVQALGLWVQGRFRIQGLGFRASGSRFRVEGFCSRVAVEALTTTVYHGTSVQKNWMVSLYNFEE